MMKKTILAAVLVCSLGTIAPAHANNASFGLGVQTPVMTDNRAQPWLADQKVMKGSSKTSASKTKQSPFLNSLQYKMKTWIKKINRDSSKTAESSN